MKLFDAPRSSACYRVRIALHYKAIPFERQWVDLLRDGGEQLRPAYLAENPQGLVPTLRDSPAAGAAPGGEHVLHQSLAIIEYLDETHPTPALLPPDPSGRARVRALAQIVACDIHPLNNLRVMRHLEHELGLAEAARLAWYQHWIAEGLAAFEAQLASDPRCGVYCYGDEVSLADLCLVPQLFNARRYGCPLDEMPTLCRIDAACNELESFRAAHPDRVAPD